MGEEFEKAVHDLAEKAEQLGAIFYEAMQEASHELQQAFDATFGDAIAAIQELIDAYVSSFKDIKTRENNCKKWRQGNSVFIRNPILDKRLKVYRCRSNC